MCKKELQQKLHTLICQFKDAFAAYFFLNYLDINLLLYFLIKLIILRTRSLRSDEKWPKSAGVTGFNFLYFWIKILR